MEAIPRDIVSNVIASFDSRKETIQRRRLGPEWFRRYLELLPCLDLNRGLEWGLTQGDEEFLIDLLIINDGDLRDIPNLNADHQTATTIWLHRFVQRNLGQKFGHALARLPKFVVNMVITLEAIFVWIQARLRSICGTDDIACFMVPLLYDLLYFEGIVRRIFIPWVRRHPEHRSLIFQYNTDPELISKLLELFISNKVELDTGDIEDVLDGNTYLTEELRLRFLNYRTVG